MKKYMKKYMYKAWNRGLTHDGEIFSETHLAFQRRVHGEINSWAEDGWVVDIMEIQPDFVGVLFVRDEE